MLSEILSTISMIADEKGLSTPYIVGGVPRDKVLQRRNDFGDIDLTTGDNTVHYLAKETAIKFQGPNTHYMLMADGHARILLNGLKIDFSSNFNVPGIKYLLKRNGIEADSSMTLELYSRDFTCNTLLLSMDLKNIYDPTKVGVRDIESRILKTCLPPKLTLGYDNKRIIRVLYLAAKLGFEVDGAIIDWIRENPELIKNCTQQYLIKKLNKALRYDRNRTIELIKEMGVWKYLPTRAS